MEVTKISTKGQVVIPAHFREELNLDIGSTVVISRMKDFLIIKKVKIKDPREEFNELTSWGTKWSKEKNIKEEDVVKKENIKPNGLVKIAITREDDLSFLWGKLKSIKIPTQEIMEIIDEDEKD